MKKLISLLILSTFFTSTSNAQNKPVESLIASSAADSPESLGKLSHALRLQGRYPEAEQLLRKALALQTTARGPDDIAVGRLLNDLAALISQDKGRLVEAQGLYEKSLAIKKKQLGENNVDVAFTIDNLALILVARGQFDKARIASRKSLEIFERTVGRFDRDYIINLLTLARIEYDAGRFDEAQKPAFVALTNAQAIPNAYELVARSAAELARIKSAVRKMAYLSGAIDSGTGSAQEALDQSRKAIRAISDAIKQAPEVARLSWLSTLTKATVLKHLEELMAASNSSNRIAYANEAFQAAQLIKLTTAGNAIQQSALRNLANSSSLANAIRMRQDLEVVLASNEKNVIQALLHSSESEIARSKTVYSSTEAAIAKLDNDILVEFPKYSSFARPQPSAVGDIQKGLSLDEALVYFVLGEKESHVFAVTAGGFRWEVIPFSEASITEKIYRLRAGLDFDSRNEVDARTQFDVSVARNLYQMLFSSTEVLLKNRKNLIIVPTGSLTALPFHVLIDRPLSRFETNSLSKRLDTFRNASWLIKNHAITILPSVSNFLTLRNSVSAVKHGKTIIGFGDPIFNRENELKENNPARGLKVAHLRGIGEFWKGKNIDKAKLSVALPRLSDTSDELQMVAKALGDDGSSIYLRDAATETKIKNISLDDYRIVYFATHGLVAGDVQGVFEPSIALSIPQYASDIDDGLLTASEISQLKLNADWVVLSACNTIAGDGPSAEALSGLVQSFFYAGGRTILVSHWAVDSAAATEITSKAFSLYSTDATLGKADALRGAMIDYLADETHPLNADPIYWAAFAVVGEGWKR